MEQFITWEMLMNYATFVSIVFMVVEFTKELPFIKKVPTRYWSAIVTFILLVITNIVTGDFATSDLMLYALSAISISLGANGLSTFNKEKIEIKKEGK